MLNVEIDVDGVLLDMLQAVADSKWGNKSHCIETSFYNFSDLPADQRERIFKGLGDPEVFKMCRPYDWVIPFMMELGDFLYNNQSVSVLIRTLVPNEECMRVRENSLRELLKYANCRNNISNLSFDIAIGNKPNLKGIDVLIEDNPTAIINSTARSKILINQMYNQEENYPTLKGVKYTRISDVSSAIDYIKGELKNV